MTSLINSSIAAAEVSRLDKLGYIPFVGTVSGACRIAYGVVKAAISAVAAVFSLIATGSKKNFGYHFVEGLLHTGRGLVELFPFVGGAITYSYDTENISSIFSWRTRSSF
jgi:hypothetical protein